MPDNDNGPFSDVERQLIGFINSIRPEAGPLLKLRATVEKWLWESKLCALICFLAVSEAILIGEWHSWPAACAICGASAPVLMIDRLERLLGRWKARLSFDQGRPAFHWHFERAGA